MLPLCDCQSIVDVALGKHQQLLSGRLCDIASRFDNGDRQLRVEFLVTALAKGNLVVRGVAAYLPALQMMDVKPDLFLLGCMSSAALAGVPVSPKHVLPYIVVTIHLALLVILTLRNRLSIRNGFQQM